MDVKNEAVYILAAQQGLAKGDCRGIGSAHNFFHGAHRNKPPTQGREPTMMNEASRPRTPVEELQDSLSSDMDAVSGLIRDRMASEHAPRIPEVTAHLVEAGGKRLRPLLTLAAARLCGYEGDNHVRLAATVEFIHTATLLHDDVVDESARRRGRPTANLLWDNKSSVLVGDYLFARAFQLMVETGSVRVLSILSNAAAVIAEGEVLQLSATANLDTNETTYLQIVRGKTAALFSAATEVGGVIAGASETETRALFEYGDALGVSFQIVDDLLDYGGASTTLGKNTGDDLREGKLTLPVIRALARADKNELDFWKRVLAARDPKDDDLRDAVVIMESHGALRSTRETAIEYSERARSALIGLPDCTIRHRLAELADFVVSRLA